MLPLFDSQPQLPLAEMVGNALADGAVVVTANARSARALTFQYAEQQRAKGVEMWPSPAIFDWDSWLGQLWQQLSAVDPDLPLLLTPWQERALWKIVQQVDAPLVVSLEGIASLAQSAYALLSNFRLQGERNSTWLETDAEHFRRWAKTFDQRCRDRKWTSRSDLVPLLSGAARAGKLSLPRQILLVGFDRFTPAQQIFLQNLRESGVIADDSPAAAPEATSRKLVVANDLREELLACASWCREKILANPVIRIGVIAPDAGSIRAEAERAFRTVLMPQSFDLAAEDQPMPFEFSLGVPLANVPVIRAALLLLRWITQPLPEEDISWLLLSGYLHVEASEREALARFDFRQRDSGALSPEAKLETFMSSRVPASFAARMRKLLETARVDGAFDGSGTYTQWADLAEPLLQAAAWPGYRTPDSVQFQAQRRWQRLLDEVTLLDFAGRGISFTAFAQALEKHAQEMIFTPESHHAPVQIMGALESSGQSFDAIWFLGADDSQWPLTGKPHPLIPAWLQRSARMPHCDVATDTELARVVTQRIVESAPECVFSYARQNKEGELRPSPLLANFFDEPRNAEAASSLHEQSNIANELPNGSGLEVLVLRSETISWPVELSAGGADTLKRQAACPFQAFAARRLQARPLNRTEWGLDAAQRGNLLHKIIENVWSPETPEPWRMTSLDDLKHMIAIQQLDAALQYHIENAFRDLVRDHGGDVWMGAYLESERTRLLTRLREWMLYEAKRHSFTVEKREEKLLDVSVGALKLNLRADRIDELNDGSHLLIDYKTGDVSVSQWQGVRPDEPQLPLYAAYGNIERLSGLLFAQIRAGQTGFVGRVANAPQTLLADTAALRSLTSQPYDESMRDQWEAALLQLAEEFLRGEASVDPKRGAKTCQYCDFPGLCRIAETERVSGITDAGGDDE
ncbi:PD-(D/E)XK nuclease family protein [Acidobacterium sp. S8]|uniref:PD-(D/E)XK nuclease family protein n=1 Tax=Acidobacterium sp. S8 TaxID=1641854 RepID=UPI00131BDBC8|nr:PD-(D/E)XK nuclease family protein [Acidobacterium sp. S8]